MPNGKKSQGEEIGIFTLINIQIAIQKMKISSVSKTFDMSDRSDLGSDSYICYRSSGLYHLNILFLCDGICKGI